MNQDTLPKVAIVGRPNVGKSSLYNRFIGKRESIIDPTPGVTRDRHYHLIQSEKYNFLLIDTGGITIDNDDNFAKSIKVQSEIAIAEADLILFAVETGILTEDDHIIADMLRKSGKNIVLVVNKCDNYKLEQSSMEMYSLGLGEPFPVSAIHGVNMGDLLDLVKSHIPVVELQESGEKSIKVAIIGKPNVGKSCLLNKITGKERSLVSDIPGTTRDAIFEKISFGSYEMDFLDTAGLRRKSKVRDDVEYYSVNRAVKSMEKSDVAIHLIDSIENISDQDKKIIGVAATRGRAMIIAINKWDLQEENAEFKQYVDYIRFKFAVAKYIPIVPISALTGYGIKKLLKLIIDIYHQYSIRVDTNALNELLEKAQDKYQPSTRKGRLKIYYGTQISSAPPKFLLFINRPELMTRNYKDYITNQLRQVFGFSGVPLTIYTRKSE